MTTDMAPDLDRLMTLMTGDEKHGPAATSTLDVLRVLYDRVLRVTPQTSDAADRDRFLLSKGHGPMAYYAVLAAKGFFPEDLLAGFGSYDSPLGHHPDRLLVPGAEIGSGSLGHGLPLGVGTVLGLRAQRLTRPRVWVLIGDAELDEGSVHEAIAYAGPHGSRTAAHRGDRQRLRALRQAGRDRGALRGGRVVDPLGRRAGPRGAVRGLHRPASGQAARRGRPGRAEEPLSKPRSPASEKRKR